MFEFNRSVCICVKKCGDLQGTGGRELSAVSLGVSLLVKVGRQLKTVPLKLLVDETLVIQGLRLFYTKIERFDLFIIFFVCQVFFEQKRTE